MKTLAMDLSSAIGSVAVADDGRVIIEASFPCERGRGAGVFVALEKLREAWREADLIAVGVGPGSYNGLRAACALANSMQMATGARLCSLPSPCILGIQDDQLIAYGDARGGRAYRAEVRDRRLVGDIALLDYASAAERAKDESGMAYRVGPVPGLDWLPESRPEASILALSAPDLLPLAADDLQPIYLKPPHITLPCAMRT